MAVLPSPPLWLNQVHGADVIVASEQSVTLNDACCDAPTADAAVSNRQQQVLAIMTADCLPVLFADRLAGVIGAAHAGWRGLAAGVLPATITKMIELGAQRDKIDAWIGPAIGPAAFEVGEEVPEAFRIASTFVMVDTSDYFVPIRGDSDKWLGNLPGLAQAQMKADGLINVTDARCCTVEDRRFYSYRRDGQTGRMASLIWLKRE